MAYSDLLTDFFRQNDWQTLVNKRSTTFRNLPAEIKDNLTEEVALKQF